MTTVGDMTFEELKTFVQATINERLEQLFGVFEISEDEFFSFTQSPDTRTWEQVQQDIERDRWTPPPGAKSSLELLREDRDS